MKKLKMMILTPLLIFLFSYAPASFPAEKKTDTPNITYVPVYSSIFHGNRDRVINLAVTLSIRNIDNSGSISVYSIDYYNSDGELIRNYLNTEKVLKPYQTMNVIVKESDTQGGNTAGFVVKWGAGKNVNDLFIEAVMIGTYPQGISFTSRGIITSR